MPQKTTMIKSVKTGKFSVLGLPSEADAVAAVSTTTAAASNSGTDNFNNSKKKKEQQPKQEQQQQQQPKNSKKAAAQQQPTTTTTATTREWNDELEQDYQRILTVGEECITPGELKTLLLKKGRGSTTADAPSPPFILYDGFEPSGRMHIAQGVFKAMNVNKCTFEGTNSVFTFWVADWFALMNDKMGGDLEKIKTVGHYLIEVWKAAGMHLKHVVFKWASTEITQQANTYWPLMLDIARRFTITRIKKCCQIMGRLEGSLTAAQILYPLMQCTDVFFLQADICQLGVDQRKVNMLAREYCDACNRKHKPVILSHHMLYGLKAGQEKMSKSDPDSAVFMEDAPEDVERKIMNAYCPNKEEEVVESAATSETPANEDDDEGDAGKASLHLTTDTLKNPCLDYIQNIIFSPPDATFTAGSTTYSEFATVRQAFLAGDLSETDLKQGLIAALNGLLEPVRNHFTNDPTAKDLLEKVQQYKKETSSSSSSAEKKTIRRLDLVQLGKVPKGTHVVFAPVPTANPTLQEAVDILAQLEAAAGADSVAPRVLFISDWSARVCNACQADVKAITANTSILIASLKALNPTIMGNVQILLQSDAILADPSNYWISVINVGRHFMLDHVMGLSSTSAAADALKDSDCVGLVIARLLHVADIAGLEPASIAVAENSEAAKLEMNMMTEFFEKQLPGMTPPTIIYKSGVSVRLQPERESEALKTENDEFFLLDDPKVHGKSKMKKTFCEPGNISFCPAIQLSRAFALAGGVVSSSSAAAAFDAPAAAAPLSLLIQRSPENGGDRVYQTAEELEREFGNQSLHPGDLKNAVSTVMVGVLERLASALKADSAASKAAKDLKAFAKKMSKAKK